MTHEQCFQQLQRRKMVRNQYHGTISISISQALKTSSSSLLSTRSSTSRRRGSSRRPRSHLPAAVPARLRKLPGGSSRPLAASAMAKARQAGFSNINLDIMWGLPGQSVAQALEDLRQAIELQPQHMSWYQLTIEPKTEFAGRPPILPVDRVLQEIEQAGLALLAEAGFQRYEVSAFARPGYACQHNLVYWSFGDYMGIGAGAHGKITQGPNIYRTQRPSQPRLYQQDSQITELTAIPQTQRPIEFMMNALRLLDGVTQQSFAERTQLPWQTVSQVWQELVDLDLVRHDRCATTGLGLRYLDSVLERFLDA